MQRKLAAILAADVVGYSRLMEIDEADTVVRLQSTREIMIDPKIAAHNGRVVKLMGDGELIEFPSVVDAVRCAVEIQQAMAECNEELPADKRLEFRIGVNLGDVIVEGQDIYGDGVNVAARLEELADHGGVLISERRTIKSRESSTTGSIFWVSAKSRTSKSPSVSIGFASANIPEPRPPRRAADPIDHGSGSRPPQQLWCWRSEAWFSGAVPARRRLRWPQGHGWNFLCQTGHRSRSCHSPTCPAMMRSNILPTV